jgi:hypothetical protein
MHSRTTCKMSRLVELGFQLVLRCLLLSHSLAPLRNAQALEGETRAWGCVFLISPEKFVSTSWPVKFRMCDATVSLKSARCIPRKFDVAPHDVECVMK